ncbi:MAG: DHH family phosphoesterase [Nanoarchaeota archaeon]
MLNDVQIKEIREHLEKAQNPVFFFDNDPDGLCAFLILQRYIGRGKGVVIKSFPALDENYFRKVQELNGDYIFILDKPVVSKGFFERAKEVNIPIVWIDHHEIDGEEIPEFVSYYNPIFNNPKSNEPTTVLCYYATKKKEDEWIALIGSVSDSYLPGFYDNFKEKFPELAVETKDPFKVLYESKIGEVAFIMSNGLKDSTTNVVNMLRYLVKVKSPYDILEENGKNRNMHKKSLEIRKKYVQLLEKAKKVYKKNGRVLFFKYGGDLSVSGELANNVKYLFPDKIVVVAYLKGSKVNISLRGSNIREKFLEALEGIDGATGGGHKDAVGGQMSADSLEKFVDKIKTLV